MRAKRRADAPTGRALPTLDKIHRARQVRADVLFLAEDTPGQQPAQPGLLGGLCHAIHVEIVIGKAHGAAANHLCHGQHRTPIDVLVGELQLDHPDPLVEPAVKRQVLGPAALERHRRVGVGVVEARHEDAVGCIDRLVSLEAGGRFAYGDDSITLDGEVSIAQDRPVFVECDDVGVADEDARHFHSPGLDKAPKPLVIIENASWMNDSYEAFRDR